MWTGRGPRRRGLRVRFASPVKEAPSVLVSVSMWDIHHKSNGRADVAAENVTEQGCDMVFHRWEDTRVTRARIRWMAVGAIAHEDDWEFV